MYHWVNDKAFIHAAYRISADLVNQLIQRLKAYDIKARMNVVGSMKRNMVTQNEKEPIDFDFNLLVENARDFQPWDLKETIRKAFNEVLRKNDLKDCDDSTSALTTKQIVLAKGRKIPFTIDVCIVSYDNYHKEIRRLIHNKTGLLAQDKYYWNDVPDSSELWEKESFLKENGYWNKVRETYLNKKKMYLTRNDHNHPSFVCYIEAVNEVYYKSKGYYRI